jgi:hypothetical protein
MWIALFSVFAGCAVAFALGAVILERYGEQLPS